MVRNKVFLSTTVKEYQRRLQAALIYVLPRHRQCDQKSFGAFKKFHGDRFSNHDACALSVFYVTRTSRWLESTSGVTIKRGTRSIDSMGE